MCGMPTNQQAGVLKFERHFPLLFSASTPDVHSFSVIMLPPFKAHHQRQYSPKPYGRLNLKLPQWKEKEYEFEIVLIYNMLTKTLKAQ